MNALKELEKKLWERNKKKTRQQRVGVLSLLLASRERVMRERWDNLFTLMAMCKSPNSKRIKLETRKVNPFVA